MANEKMKMGVKAAVYAALLWLCLAAPAAFAGAMEDGLAAYEQQDYATALRFWRPLADQGNAFAQLNLGGMYDNGWGVPQDYVQAVAWYRKAAEQVNANAQNNLGVMYRNGQGVPEDYVQAHLWFNLAAARFPAADVDRRKLTADNRDELAAKMTPAQIAEAQRLAREWKPE